MPFRPGRIGNPSYGFKIACRGVGTDWQLSLLFEDPRSPAADREDGATRRCPDPTPFPLLRSVLRLATNNKAILFLRHVCPGDTKPVPWHAYPSVREALERWGLLEAGARRSDVFGVTSGRASCRFAGRRCGRSRASCSLPGPERSRSPSPQSGCPHPGSIARGRGGPRRYPRPGR
jgi:hypothetical protein